MMVLTLGQLICLAISLTGTFGHSRVGTNNNKKFGVAPRNIASSLIDDNRLTLSQRMWKETKDIAELAFNTSFVQGLRYGTLPPTKFGAYMVQDAVYLEKQADALMIASLNVVNKLGKKLREFLIGTAANWTRYANDMYVEWQLTNPSCVRLNSASKAYIDHKITVAETMDPVYTIVAMIHCLKLWPWIGQEFDRKGHSSGLYEEWVGDNFDPKYVGYEINDKMVDEWDSKGWIDEKKAKTVYTKSMNAEYGFFASAMK